MSVLSSLKSLLWKTKEGVGSVSVSGDLQSQKNQAVPRPWTSDPVQQLYFTKGYTVRLKAGIKKVPLFRFLLAKMVYGREHEGVSVEEFLVFNELFFDLSDSKDPNLGKKWGPSFVKVSSIIPAMSDISEFPIVLDTESREALKQIFLDDPILPNPEAYFGLLGNRDLRNSFRVQFKSSWIPPKRVERYIGVGYKDKGSRRIPELDGSPSWQRVATVLANREREQEEAEAAYFAPQAE
jgi:hypothetical protein